MAKSISMTDTPDSGKSTYLKTLQTDNKKIEIASNTTERKCASCDCWYEEDPEYRRCFKCNNYDRWMPYKKR